MNRDAGWARSRFAEARLGRLATVSPDGRPHLVPMVFALMTSGLVSAVDDKPKRTTALRRLANIAANPAVSVLVDDYDEDWTRLWWARADGQAQVRAASVAPAAIAALTARYPQYREHLPTGPVIVIDVQRWSGWSASIQ